MYVYIILNDTTKHLVFELSTRATRRLIDLVDWAEDLRTPGQERVEGVTLASCYGFAYTQIPEEAEEALAVAPYMWALCEKAPDETKKALMESMRMEVSGSGVWFRLCIRYQGDMTCWIPKKELEQWIPDPLVILAEGELNDE